MYVHMPTILLLVMLQLADLTISRRDSHIYQVDENLMLVRCQMRYCPMTIISKLDDCSLEKCLAHSLNSFKQGECPAASPPANSVEALCMDTCSGRDFSCPGTHKCCRHACGRTCRPAAGLDRVADHVLPAIPTEVTATSTMLERQADIGWRQSYAITSNKNISFVLEARSHPGYHFSQHKLGQWFKMNYDLSSEQELPWTGDGLKKIEYTVLVRLRLGIWYTFRIAAVNENGTRGYSNTSQRFQLKERPRNPLAPRKFAIDKPPRILANQSVHVRVTWKPQRSEYPTERYRIAWSLHLQSDNISQNQSLWRNDAFISEPTRFFEFWDLRPNAFYYIQLQALSAFGRKTLKSPIETLFLNTTVKATHRTSLPNSDVSRQMPPRPVVNVQYLSSTKCTLLVRVDWTETAEGGGILELCRGGAECHRSKAFGHKSKVRPKGRHFDFADLPFDQRYSVRLLIGHRRKWDIPKTFWTPSAKQFRRNHTNCV